MALFLINALLEEDVFIRREALEKVNRLLSSLNLKVGVYVNLRFQMQETDQLNVTLPLSPSYEGRPAVRTGRVLCHMFYRLLKKEREKIQTSKTSNIEHFKETTLRWKNCSYEYKIVHAPVDWKKGKKWRINSTKEHSLRKVFLFKRERSCNCSKCF